MSGMSKMKKAVYLVIGWFVVLIPLMVIVELVFGNWLVAPDKWDKVNKLNVVRDKRIEYDLDDRYQSGGDKIIYTRNKFGLRDRCKSPADIGILTVGGSTTDQRYIPDGKTFQDVLQARLKAATGKDICISNAGVDGHSTYGHLASFEVWFPLIPGLSPRHILLYVGINDAVLRDGPNLGFDVEATQGEAGIKKYLKDHSAIYNMFRAVRNLIFYPGMNKAYAGHSPKSFEDSVYTATSPAADIAELSRDHAREFSGRFEDILKKVKQMGAKPVCVSQPHMMVKNVNGEVRGVARSFRYHGTWYNGLDSDTLERADDAEMSRLCVQYGGVFLDMRNKKFEPGDYYDYAHMTPAGEERLGGYLADMYIKGRLVGDF